jgi:hypothetical protein
MHQNFVTVRRYRSCPQPVNKGGEEKDRCQKVSDGQSGQQDGQEEAGQQEDDQNEGRQEARGEKSVSIRRGAFQCCTPIDCEFRQTG